MIQKEFVPPQESLELKELGFNDPCLKFYVDGMMVLVPDTENGDTNSNLNGYNPLYVSAPTFSQAFRFFRDKYDLDHYVDRNDDIMIKHVKSKGLKNLPKYACGYSDGSGHPIKSCDSYEEGELVCLRKLIEVVKQEGCNNV